MDWQLLISDLTNRGWTQVQIANACNCKQSTVSDIATGATKNPGFALGQALVALHKSKRKLPELKAA